MKKAIFVSFVFLVFLSSVIALSSNLHQGRKDLPLSGGAIADGYTQRLAGNDSLQLISDGHVLMFKAAEVIMAAGDHALKVRFMGASNAQPRQEGEVGELDKGASFLDKVVYHELYPGVDLVYEKSDVGLVKSTWHIAAGQAERALAAIAIQYNVPVRIDPSGELVQTFATGEMRESRPVAWQEVNGKLLPVDVGYSINEDDSVGFSAKNIDPDLTLVIDPISMWNTFLGSATTESGRGIVVDDSGNVFVVGDGAGSWGSPIRAFSGNYDVFVAKLDANGSLAWNTFLGSTVADYGYGIALDTSGNVFVTGRSDGSWGIPLHPNSGGKDIFVAKLNATGVLQWNTFWGCALWDEGRGIKLDGSGNIFVTGFSQGQWGIAIRNHSYYGSPDAFVLKLQANGELFWNTFLGSSDADGGYGICLDSVGNIYVTGDAYAPWGGPTIRAFSGGVDAFVAKLDSGGALAWNTFLGSSQNEIGNSIVNDADGNVLITGNSAGNWGSPIRNFSGSNDAFVAKLSSDGALLWNTFIGASLEDRGQCIALDQSDNIFVAGYSSSSWESPIRAFSGGYDAFVAKLNSSGALLWNSFLGGYNWDYGNGIALDDKNNVFLAGDGYSTWGSPIRAFAGNVDCLVVKLDYHLTISGTIVIGGLPLANVMMNGLPGTPVTDSSGVYASQVDYGWSGEVVPALDGYSFAPSSRTYNNVVADQNIQDYSATLNQYTISGTVMYGSLPLANVSMNGLPGGPLTDSSGFYSAEVDHGWSGTVTPSLSTSYMFSPFNRSYSDVSSHLTSQNYSATYLHFRPVITEGESISVSCDEDNSPTAFALTLHATDMNGDVLTWSIETQAIHGTAAASGTGNEKAIGYIPAENYNGSDSFVVKVADTSIGVDTITVNVTINPQPDLPQLTTEAVSGIVAIQAVGNGTITAIDANASVRGFCWNTTGSPTIADAHSEEAGSFGPGTFSGTLTGLTAGTQYHVRAYATDAGGTGYGNEVAFTTLAGLPQPERDALIALYNSTNGDSWTNNSGWKEPPLHTDGFALPGTEGMWFGITVENDHVKKIHLFNNNLTGTLPTHIGDLSGVSEFFLGMNAISGSIPSAIGNMASLWIVNLSDNQFTGNIPAEIGNLTNLEGLSIEMNQLTGNVPAEIGNLTNLDRLYLGYNQLAGAIPVEITSITGLRQLDLRSNQLSGEIPAQIGSLTDLEWLFMQNNRLSGSIPVGIGNLTKLVYLELNGNQFTGNVPSQLGNLVQLISLGFAGNRLSGVIPIEIADLVNLDSASIGYNALFSDDSDLIAFLGSKDPDWAATQTIAPENVAATPVNSTTINLTWDAIPYTGATGGYRIFVATTSGGPYSFFQQTTDKTVTSLPVSGLNPGTPYYFVVQTRTDAHVNNQNVVDSEYSSEAVATTIPVYTVTFLAGSGGTLTGETTQIVEHGSSCTPVTAEPNIGYHFVDWTGSYAGTDNPLTVANVTSNMTITANFTLNQYTVTFVEGAGGTISGTKVQTVNHGGSTAPVTAEPNIGYHFVDWTGSYAGIDNPLTVTNVTSDMTITANFAVNQYTVTFIEGTGGTITGTKEQTVNHGGSTSEVTAVPNTGYSFVDWTGDYHGTANPLTISNVTADMTVTANFTLSSLTISGTILYNSSPLSGVVMNGLPGSPATDASGFYTASVDYDWSGTVTPTLAGYAFTPASRSYSNVTSDQANQDYTAALAPSLQLTSPNGWEHWTLGSTKTITWNAVNYTGTVRLVLFKAGSRFGNIVANIPATAGSYSWTVGLTYDNGMAPEGADYRLYLRSTDGTIIDPSDYRLGLIDPAQLEVTSPNGGESWELGTTQNITWNANGYVGTVRLILFQKAAKIGQIVANLPADQGSYAWTVGTHQAGVAPAGILYSIRVLAGDGSQDDYSDGPLTLIENDALIVDHQHTSINTIPSQWLDQASREKLLVLSTAGNDAMTLGLRLLGKRDSRLAPSASAGELGLALNEGSWLPQGASLDLQEWRWSLEKAILESQATVVIVRPDEQALLAGKLNAESYLSVLNELAIRLPGVKLVCSTVAMDEANELLAKFNARVRESVLRNKGMLFDAADIESWRGGEQHVVNDVPVRHPAYRISTGTPASENLANQGSAAWWLLARLCGWEGPGSSGIDEKL